LIIYGTKAEVPTNQEAAEALQRALIERGWNYEVPIKSDKEVTEEDLKSHHLLLIGRPNTNRVVEQVCGSLPVQFGPQSFTVRHETYAHPGSALIAAGENPLNRRYSVVVMAGLSAEETLRAAPALMSRVGRTAEVVVLPHNARTRALV